ncbi:MAG: hypothetical protein M1539_05745 [Actinobacteria bacterium]|nr:hypothetical protein [Actinomycetota bacterium]MCL5883463.1 hypothetical protein [Actinomycetota bacterium]
MSRHPEHQHTARGLSQGTILFLIVLASLIINTIMTLKRTTLQFDEIEYVRMAENLAAGKGPLEVSGLTSTHFTALLPLGIAAAATVFRSYVFSAYLVVTIFWSLITVPTYLLGRGLANGKVGLMAAALVAVMPAFIVNREYVYSESLYIFFLLFAIVFGRHMFRGCRVPCSILAGTSLGLAYLANPAALYYVLLFAGLAAAVAIRNGIWRHMAKATGLFLLFFALFATPYVLFLHAELGRWTYSGKTVGGPIYEASNNLSGAPTIQSERDLESLTDDNTTLKIFQLEADTSVNNPINFAIAYPKQAVKNFFSQLTVLHNQVMVELVPLWLLPLAGLGLFAVGWTRRKAAGVGYLLLMLGPGVLNMMVLAYPRFFLAFVPLLMVWVAMGWSKLQEWGGETVGLSFSEPRASRYRRWVPWILGVAILLPPLALAAHDGYLYTYDTGDKQAGQWIKAETGGGARIMNAVAAYYAGGTLVTPPFADYDRTTAYARYQHVDYMVFDRKALAGDHAELSRLLGPAASHPEWKLVDEIQPSSSSDPADQILIFHLEKADT